MTTTGKIRLRKSRPYAGKDTRNLPGFQLKTQKSIAKAGMTGSIGALLVSGFFKFQGAKQLHLYSGFGLLAFTLWHHILNRPNTKSKPKN